MRRRRTCTPGLAKIIPLVQKVAVAAKSAFDADGVSIAQFNETAGGQTVFHLHIHLVPRWEQDAIGRIWPPETHYSEQQKDDAWDRLRRECAQIVRTD